MPNDRLTRHLYRSLSVLLICAVPTAAYAQGRMTTGEIVVHARDMEGAVLPGATVTLSGVGLVQETVAESTGPDGAFRFRNLRPGTYRLEVDLEGFEGAAFEEVIVRVGQTTTIDAALRVGGVSETVTVLSQTPAIELESSQIAIGYDEQLIQNLPLPRDFISVADLTPGVTDRGAYGAGANIEGRYRVGSGANAYKLNGVDVTEPNWGNTWINPGIDTIAEVQVVGIGASAEYGNFMGTTVNLVTKSGTNEFHGAASFYHSGDSLQAENAEIPDLVHASSRYDQDYSLSLGGPLVRRELLFFANAGWVRESGAFAESENYFDHDRYRFHGRVDWLLDEHNTIGLMFNTDPARDRDLGLTAAQPDPEIGYSIDFGSQTWLASWQSNPTVDTFIDVRYSGYHGSNENTPNVCCDTPSLRNGATNLRYGSSGFYGSETNGRHEVDASVTHYVRDFLGADHDLELGIEIEDTWSFYDHQFTGDVGIFTYTYGNYTLVYGYTYDAHFDVDVKRVGAYVQDDIAVSDRLHVNLGLRFDRPRMIDAFEGNDVQVAAFENLAPRVGLSYDLSGAGTLVARANYGRYFEKALSFGPLSSGGDAFDPLRFYLMFLPGPIDYETVDIRALHDDLVRPENLLFEGPYAATPVDPDLKGPHTDVFSVGLQSQVSPEYVVSLDYIHKRDRNFVIFEDRNAAQHTYEPLEYTDYLGGTQTLYRRTDSVAPDLWMTNDDYYYRRHHLITAQVVRRPSSGFNLLGSVTYQHSTGNIENDIQAAWGFGSNSEHTSPNFNGHPYTEGTLTFDRSWQFKLVANYRLPADVHLGAYYTWQSGRPWTPTARTGRLDLNDVAPTGNLRIEPRGNRRWDPTHTLDLRAQRSFRRPFGLRDGSFDVMLDVFNVFNNAAPLRVATNNTQVYPISGTPAFGLPLSLTRPREARIGVRFVF